MSGHIASSCVRNVLPLPALSQDFEKACMPVRHYPESTTISTTIQVKSAATDANGYAGCRLPELPQPLLRRRNSIFKCKIQKPVAHYPIVRKAPRTHFLMYMNPSKHMEAPHQYAATPGPASRTNSFGDCC